MDIQLQHRRERAGTRYAAALGTLRDCLVELAAVDRALANGQPPSEWPKTFNGVPRNWHGSGLQHPIYAPGAGGDILEDVARRSDEILRER